MSYIETGDRVRVDFFGHAVNYENGVWEIEPEIGPSSIRVPVHGFFIKRAPEKFRAGQVWELKDTKERFLVYSGEDGQSPVTLTDVSGEPRTLYGSANDYKRRFMLIADSAGTSAERDWQTGP